MKSEGYPVLSNMIKRLVAFPRSALVGAPVWDYSAGGDDAWKLYERVGSELYSGVLGGAK